MQRYAKTHVLEPLQLGIGARHGDHGDRARRAVSQLLQGVLQFQRQAAAFATDHADRNLRRAGPAVADLHRAFGERGGHAALQRLPPCGQSGDTRVRVSDVQRSAGGRGAYASGLGKQLPGESLLAFWGLNLPIADATEKLVVVPANLERARAVPSHLDESLFVLDGRTKPHTRREQIHQLAGTGVRLTLDQVLRSHAQVERQAIAARLPDLVADAE